MSYSNGALLLASATFIGQVRVALLVAAYAIANESPSTEFHAKRKQVSDAMLYSQGTAELMVNLMSRLIIATNSTIRDDVTPDDSDVEFVVASQLALEPTLDALLNL